jgi:hypothetical protein
MPDAGATSSKTPPISPEMQAALDEAAKKIPVPVQPEMQAAIDAIGKSTPYYDHPPTPEEAGLMGQSGSDVGGVAPEELEKTGHVVPTSPSDLPSEPSESPTSKPVPIPPKIQPSPAVVGKQAPTTKEMLATILNSGGPPPDVKKGANIGEMLAGLGDKAGDFLQRWGMGLQGAPEGKTQGDIKRAQAFELAKQKALAEVQAKQAAVEQEYFLSRMNIQNQLNIANLPIEKKAELQNTLAAIEAQHQARIAEFGPEYEQRLRLAGMAPGANAGTHFVGQ